MIYVNKIENRITFKIKTGYYLELLTPQTMKLLESTNCTNCNKYIAILLKTIINKIKESCIHLFLINPLVNY